MAGPIYEAASAPGGVAPVYKEAAPALNRAEPTPDGVAPVDKEAAPALDEAAPTLGGVAPVDGEAILALDEAALTPDGVASAHKEETLQQWAPVNKLATPEAVSLDALSKCKTRTKFVLFLCVLKNETHKKCLNFWKIRFKLKHLFY